MITLSKKIEKFYLADALLTVAIRTVIKWIGRTPEQCVKLSYTYCAVIPITRENMPVDYQCVHWYWHWLSHCSVKISLRSCSFQCVTIERSMQVCIEEESMGYD